jgi:hypothetical protein
MTHQSREVHAMLRLLERAYPAEIEVSDLADRQWLDEAYPAEIKRQAEALRLGHARPIYVTPRLLAPNHLGRRRSRPLHFILDGHHRYYAAFQLGLKSLQAFVLPSAEANSEWFPGLYARHIEAHPDEAGRFPIPHHLNFGSSSGRH